MNATASRCVFAVVLAASTVFGQWVETTIPLPDTFCGLLRPSKVELNPRTGITYVAGAGWSVDFVIGADARTFAKVSRIGLPKTVNGMCCAPLWNKLYLCSDYGRTLVVDCLQNRIIRTLDSCFGPACYNEREDKVYMCGGGHGLTVVDGATGSVLKRLPETGTKGRLNPVTNKLYLINGSALTVIDGSADTVVGKLGLRWPFTSACSDDVHNKLFGTWPGYIDFPDSVVTVIDGAGDSIIDAVVVGLRPTTLCFNRASGKVYCGASDGIHIIDAVSHAVVKVIARPHASFGNMYCDPLVNRVYCLDLDYWNGYVLVLDGSTDSVISEVSLYGWPECVYADTMNHRCLVPLWSEGRVAVIDGVTGRYDTSLYVGDNGPRAICFSPANERTYVGWGDRTIACIDGASNRIVSSFTLPSNADMFCYVSKHNRMYCMDAENDTAIAVFDCGRDSVAGTIPVGEWPSAMCYSDRRDRVFCSVDDAREVVAIDCVTDSVVARTCVDDYATAMYYDAVSDKVYAADDEEDVLILDAASNALLATLYVGSCPSALCADSSGRKVYCANEADCWCGDPSVAVIDAFGDSLLKMIYVRDCPFDLASRRTGNKIYCASSGVIWVIDAELDTIVKQIPVAELSGMCYDSAADRLYCTTQPNGLVVVDCEYDQVTVALPVGEEPGPMALNPRLGKLYVANRGSTSVSLIRSIPGVKSEPDDSFPTTIINRQLRLPLALSADLLDISGRRVAHLKPGKNDLRSEPSGVYFLWMDGRLARKIIVQH